MTLECQIIVLLSFVNIRISVIGPIELFVFKTNNFANEKQTNF